MTELEALRHRLFLVALAVTNPDRDHVDRCVDVLRIVGSADDWAPPIGPVDPATIMRHLGRPGDV
jgi:hypothetical protein